MSKVTAPKLSTVIEIGESKIREHLEEFVRGTLAETLNNTVSQRLETPTKSGRFNRLPLHGEPSSLVVGQANAALAVRFFQDRVLSAKVLDDIPLMPGDPAGQTDDD